MSGLIVGCQSIDVPRQRRTLSGNVTRITRATRGARRQGGGQKLAGLGGVAGNEQMPGKSGDLKKSRPMKPEPPAVANHQSAIGHFQTFNNLYFGTSHLLEGGSCSFGG